MENISYKIHWVLKGNHKSKPMVQLLDDELYQVSLGNGPSRERGLFRFFLNISQLLHWIFQVKLKHVFQWHGKYWMELALKFHENMRKTMQTDPGASENSWAKQTTISIQKL